MQDSFPTVFPLPLGNANAYAIRDRRGVLLVDAGRPGSEEELLRRLGGLNIFPEEIGLTVVTHVHYDHVGALAAVREAAGCTVAVHAAENELLAQGGVVLPPGTGRLGRSLIAVGGILARLFPAATRYRPVAADLVVTGEMSLEPYGIAGLIVPTPGHTKGSVSVLLDDGSAFVGDLAFNVFPWGGPVFPPFAEDVPRLLESWRLLLSRDVRTIYPGHGGPFAAPALRAAWEKHRGKATAAR